MTGRTFWITALPILALVSAGRIEAQCPDADWTLLAATGDVADIEIGAGVAWIAARGGVIRIELAGIAGGDPEQKRITDSDGLVSTDVTALTIDSFGNVWVGTRESGASVFSAEGRHVTDLSAFDAVLRSDLVVGMHALDDQRVVVTSVDRFGGGDLPEGGGFLVLRVAEDGEGGLDLEAEGLGSDLEVPTAIASDDAALWFGTAQQGLWRADIDDPAATIARVTPESGELVSNEILSLISAPSFAHGGAEVLWVGTAEGLQRFDGTAIDTLSVFFGDEIHDLYRRGDDLYFVARTAAAVYDLYVVDLTVPFAAQIVPRVGCVVNPGYVPRQVAADGAGRVVLGTERDGIAIREAGEWFCPRPLGPHSASVSDLTISTDGSLFFGTGDKPRLLSSRGAGFFDGADWTALTFELDDLNIVSVEAWPDGSVWLASNRDAARGVVHRYVSSDSIETYHDDALEEPDGVTAGRNCYRVVADRNQTLWAVYATRGGGLSAIEYPSRTITNFEPALFAANDLLRDAAFDSRGRVWISTFAGGGFPGRVYVIDPRGTLRDQGDDVYTEFEIDEIGGTVDIGSVNSILIDDGDRVWLAGEEGELVRGVIGPDLAGRPTVDWEVLPLTSSQTGGRNLSPRVLELDWDGNVWIGTDEHGVARVSSDGVIWTWFDQLEGCPLPDQATLGLHVDRDARAVYVGTATQGIARIDLSGGSSGPGAELGAQPYPNPWQPAIHGALRFGGLPSEMFTTIRVYTVEGELVFLGEDRRREGQSWDGRNLRDQLVEAGVYLVTATAEDGRVFEGKVAVVR